MDKVRNEQYAYVAVKSIVRRLPRLNSLSGILILQGKPSVRPSSRTRLFTFQGPSLSVTCMQTPPPPRISLEANTVYGPKNSSAILELATSLNVLTAAVASNKYPGGIVQGKLVRQVLIT